MRTAADIRQRDNGGAMHLYLKLTAFILAFIVLSWLSGDAADMHLYEAGFALRCQIATLRQDETMQDSLAQEYQQHVRVMKERDVEAAATVASRGCRFAWRHHAPDDAGIARPVKFKTLFGPTLQSSFRTTAPAIEGVETGDAENGDAASFNSPERAPRRVRPFFHKDPAAFPPTNGGRGPRVRLGLMRALRCVASPARARRAMRRPGLFFGKWRCGTGGVQSRER
jgi:hypothetical protein